MPSNNNYDLNRYRKDSTGAAWFVGIIVALALLSIAYLVFSNSTGIGA